MTGNAGEDVFVLRSGQGRDVINDFQQGVDSILLDGVGLADLDYGFNGSATIIKIKEDDTTLAAIKGVALTNGDFLEPSAAASILDLDGTDPQALLV